MQAALESALAELAFGPAIDPDDPAAIAAWLERYDFGAADAAALTRDFSRLLVYRTLIRRNLRGALESTLPRTMARLGARFEHDFNEFLELCPPTSHLLKDVTPRFLEFALPRWQRDAQVPAYLSDLARHEALQVEVATLLARPKANIEAELALDQPVELIDATRLVHYDYSVHRLPEATDTRAPPERQPTSLLVYRSPEHEVRYLELSPFAAALLTCLISKRQTLRAGLISAAAKLQLTLNDDLLAGCARLLADLAERGALLGRLRKMP